MKWLMGLKLIGKFSIGSLFFDGCLFALTKALTDCINFYVRCGDVYATIFPVITYGFLFPSRQTFIGELSSTETISITKHIKSTST